jgi:hypothetical protein
MPGRKPGELVNAVKEHPEDRRITYKTFARHAELGPLRAADHPAMYRISSPENWAISFHRSRLPTGAPVYYFVWSGIEFFFVQEQPDVEAEVAALDRLAGGHGQRARGQESTRQENPVAPRMAYVAANFPAFVALATFGAWAEATGEHAARTRVAEGFHAWRGKTGQEGPVERTHAYPQNEPRAQAAVARLSEMEIPQSTRFDRYLPWAAREFNRIYRPYRRAAKRHGLPAWPSGYDAGRRTFVYFPVEMEPVTQEAGALGREVRELQDGFRVIVDFAEATGVDLNEYQWVDALRQAGQWGQHQSVTGVHAGPVLYRWADGWTVQELLTEDQLEGEATVMQHCVDAYADDVAAGAVRVFSLRDPNGLPHATMEWSPEGSYAVQLRGKQNAAPNLPYLLRMVAFRRDALPVPRVEMQPWVGFQPGIFSAFREEFLGAWLVGEKKHQGPIDPWSEDFDRVLLYKGRQGKLLAYSLEDLDTGLDKVQEWVQTTTEDPAMPDYEADEEAYYRWEEAVIDYQVRYSPIEGDRNTRPFVDSEYELPNAGAAPWAMWMATGELLGSGDDEMVEWMNAGAANLVPNSPAIPTGIMEMKRRLLA